MRIEGDNNNRANEILTGMIVALIVLIAFTVKVSAAEPVLDAPLAGQTICYEVYPQTKEIEESRQRLEEIGVRIPNDVCYWCKVHGQEYGISPEILMAICWTESNCIADITSGDGSCKGLMQIKPTSHHRRMARLNVKNIYEARDNILTGTDYLAELMQSEDLPTALTIYNGNTGAIEASRKGQYTSYVKKILQIAQDLENVHFSIENGLSAPNR